MLPIGSREDRNTVLKDQNNELLPLYHRLINLKKADGVSDAKKKRSAGATDYSGWSIQ